MPKRRTTRAAAWRRRGLLRRCCAPGSPRSLEASQLPTPTSQLPTSKTTALVRFARTFSRLLCHHFHVGSVPTVKRDACDGARAHKCSRLGSWRLGIGSWSEWGSRLLHL